MRSASVRTAWRDEREESRSDRRSEMSELFPQYVKDGGATLARFCSASFVEPDERGTVTSDELQKLITLVSYYDNLRKRLSSFDSDGDGAVSISELAIIREKFALPRIKFSDVARADASVDLNDLALIVASIQLAPPPPPASTPASVADEEEEESPPAAPREEETRERAREVWSAMDFSSRGQLSVGEAESGVESVVLGLGGDKCLLKRCMGQVLGMSREAAYLGGRSVRYAEFEKVCVVLQEFYRLIEDLCSCCPVVSSRGGRKRQATPLGFSDFAAACSRVKRFPVGSVGCVEREWSTLEFNHSGSIFYDDLCLYLAVQKVCGGGIAKPLSPGPRQQETLCSPRTGGKAKATPPRLRLAGTVVRNLVPGLPIPPASARAAPRPSRRNEVDEADDGGDPHSAPTSPVLSAAQPGVSPRTVQGSSRPRKI